MKHFLAPLLLLATVAHAQTTPATTSAPTSRPAFTLGPQTTRITAPLLPDGRPDYVTALDQSLRKGITPDNNAFVALLMVLGTGPETIPEKTHTQALQRLGITQEYPARFQSFPAYLKKQGTDYSPALQDQEAALRKRPWNAKECPELANWLSDNDAALNQIAQAATRDRYYWPLIATTDRDATSQVLLPGLSGIRLGGTALAMRAMLRLEQGQIKECQADLLAVHRLGRLISQGPTLIERLVGIALEAIAAQADVELATGLNAELAMAYLADLAKLPARNTMTDGTDVFERYMALDAALTIRQFGLKAINPATGTTDYSQLPAAKGLDTAQVNFDNVLTLINEWYDRMVAAMSQPTHAQRQAAMAAVMKDVQSISDKLRDNPGDGAPPVDHTQRITDILVTLVFPSLDKTRELSDRAQTHTDLATLALALAAYHGDHKAYPDKLADLSPAYLKAIPADIFANAPLTYQKDGPGYLLYSLGPNLTDDHGTPGKTDATGDIVVRKTK